MTAPSTQDAFTIEAHGDITVIEVSPALESMEPALVEGAAAFMLEPLRRQQSPLVIVDLSKVKTFGSTFLALLIRCWKLASGKSGQLVVCGASEQSRELLRITSLDIVLPIYANRREAMESLLAD
jgi:anti-sigma B factor antagonist